MRQAQPRTLVLAAGAKLLTNAAPGFQNYAREPGYVLCKTKQTIRYYTGLVPTNLAHILSVSATGLWVRIRRVSI